MKFAFIREHRRTFPITALCTMLGVSRSGFHASCGRALSPRRRSDGVLALHVAAVQQRSRGTYGSPRIHAELRAQGVRVGRKRIARLMRENGLQTRRKRRFRHTTDSKHDDPIAPNLVARRFTVEAPNRVWVTDVTAIWTLRGWTYLAAMLDLYSRRVIGWAMSASNDTALALDALRAAVRLRRPRVGLVHHSDRGSPYAGADYRTELARHGFTASMSRKGDCWDNAVAESFFATLKAELVEHETYADLEGARRSIGEYIDGFYNAERRHSHLNYTNPIEHELRCTNPEIRA